MEKMINCISACENYCSMIQDVNFLLAEFLDGNRLDLNEGSEINVQIKLSQQVLDKENYRQQELLGLPGYS